MRGQLRLLLQSLAAFLLRADRAAEAAVIAARVAQLASEARDTALYAMALSLRADALHRTGDSAAALCAADEAVQIQRERGDPMEALTLLRRAEILAALDRPERALTDARAAKRAADHRGERDLAIGAALWEALHLAEAGAAPPEALARALHEAEASGVTFRERTKNLAERARAWLAARI
jgi:tetratricopeptide (TPR) repeat protein